MGHLAEGLDHVESGPLRRNRPCGPRPSIGTFRTRTASVWTSNQCDPDSVCLFFGDRVDESAFTTVHSRGGRCRQVIREGRQGRRLAPGASTSRSDRPLPVRAVTGTEARAPGGLPSAAPAARPGRRRRRPPRAAPRSADAPRSWPPPRPRRARCCPARPRPHRRGPVAAVALAAAKAPRPARTTGPDNREGKRSRERFGTGTLPGDGRAPGSDAGRPQVRARADGQRGTTGAVRRKGNDPAKSRRIAVNRTCTSRHPVDVRRGIRPLSGFSSNGRNDWGLHLRKHRQPPLAAAIKSAGE